MLSTELRWSILQAVCLWRIRAENPDLAGVFPTSILDLIQKNETEDSGKSIKECYFAYFTQYTQTFGLKGTEYTPSPDLILHF